MCDHHEHNEDKHTVLKICTAAIIFAAGMLTDFEGTARFLIFFAAYLISGYDILLKAAKNILKGEIFDENFLMGLATLGAILIGEYPEAVMVMILYQTGEYFQHRAVEKSRHSITELMDIRPDYANIEQNGQIIRKSPSEIHTDDIIIVKTGEKIPLDGVVIEGTAIADCSALTGESAPKTLKEGGLALSGCINTNGLIRIRVTKEYSESTVSKILELVEHASSRKAKAEHFITKFARYYTPIVVFCALVLAIVPPVVLSAPYEIWIERALTFLVISCPCALVISIPLGFFAGIGGASRAGILIKGSNYIEALSKPYAIVFDKTGTLTIGTFKVTKISPAKGITENELLEIAATAENYSNHPIAVSIKSAYNMPVEKSIVSEVTELAGYGIKTKINDDTVLAGNAKLMEKFNINYEAASEPGTVIYLAKNEKYIGRIIISDEIKEDSAAAIQSLKKLADKVVMLTGDSAQTAGYIAQLLGIKECYAQLLPSDKVEKVEELINTKPAGKSVIFAGDGINDAPVLTRADAGIAMGALGTDAAIEAADIVIMDDKPSKIVLAVKIARKTMQIVKQNIIFAIGIKVLFLILGAIGLMTMWGAVFADVGVTLLAVLNSLRALQNRSIQ